MSRVVAAVIAGTVAGTPLSPALIAAPLADQVVVRTYNNSRVAHRELATALETARAILSGVTIDLVWRECGRCDEAVDPRELIVRIVEAPGQAVPKSLGYSLVDIQQGSGTLATIFAKRVESLATAAAFDPGVLLGRTIAHELAHLLIGTTEHSGRGLMRAQWNTRDVVRDLQGDWVLSRDEGTRMRRGLVARAVATCACDGRRGGRRARRRTAETHRCRAGNALRTESVDHCKNYSTLTAAIVRRPRRGPLELRRFSSARRLALTGYAFGVRRQVILNTSRSPSRRINTMLGNPAFGYGAKFVNVTGTSGEDDHHQRDNASDQRYHHSYPEHSALSMRRSRSGRLTMPFGNVCRF
jgi:hypothetical protein